MPGITFYFFFFFFHFFPSLTPPLSLSLSLSLSYFVFISFSFFIRMFLVERRAQTKSLICREPMRFADRKCDLIRSGINPLFSFDRSKTTYNLWPFDNSLNLAWRPANSFTDVPRYGGTSLSPFGLLTRGATVGIETARRDYSTLIKGLPWSCARRSADDPGEATIAAGESRRDSELLLHGRRCAATPDPLAEKRKESFP